MASNQENQFGSDPLAKILEQRRKQAEANLEINPDSLPPKTIPKYSNLDQSDYGPEPTLGEIISSSLEQRRKALPRTWIGEARDEFLQDADEIYALQKINTPQSAASYKTRRGADEGVLVDDRVDEFYNSEKVQDFINLPELAAVKREVIDKHGDTLPEEIKLAFIAGANDEDYAKKYLSDPMYFIKLAQQKRDEILRIQEGVKNAGLGKGLIGELAAGFVPLSQEEAGLFGVQLLGGIGVYAKLAKAGMMSRALQTGAFEGGVTGAVHFDEIAGFGNETEFRRTGQTSPDERVKVLGGLELEVKNAEDGIKKQVAIERLERTKQTFALQDDFVKQAGQDRLIEAGLAAGLGAGFSVGADVVKRFFGGITPKDLPEVVNKNPDVPPSKIITETKEGQGSKAFSDEDRKKTPKGKKKTDKPKRDLTGQSEEFQSAYQARMKMNDEASKVNLTDEQAAFLFNKLPDDKKRNAAIVKIGKLPPAVRDEVMVDEDTIDEFLFGVDTDFGDGVVGIAPVDRPVDEIVNAYNIAIANDAARKAAHAANEPSGGRDPGKKTPTRSKIDERNKAAVAELEKRHKENPTEIGKVDIKSLKVDSDGKVSYEVDVDGKVKKQTVPGIKVVAVEVPKGIRGKFGDEDIGGFVYRGFIETPNSKTPAKATNFVVSGNDPNGVAIAALAHKHNIDTVQIGAQALRIGNITIIKEGEYFAVYDTATSTLIKKYRSTDEAIRSIADKIVDRDNSLEAFELFTNCLTNGSFISPGKATGDTLAASVKIPVGTPFRGFSGKSQAERALMASEGVFDRQKFGKGK